MFSGWQTVEMAAVTLDGLSSIYELVYEWWSSYELCRELKVSSWPVLAYFYRLIVAATNFREAFSGSPFEKSFFCSRLLGVCA